jgi:hypothetical protein
MLRDPAGYLAARSANAASGLRDWEHRCQADVACGGDADQAQVAARLPSTFEPYTALEKDEQVRIFCITSL